MQDDTEGGGVAFADVGMAFIDVGVVDEWISYSLCMSSNRE